MFYKLVFIRGDLECFHRVTHKYEDDRNTLFILNIIIIIFFFLQ